MIPILSYVDSELLAQQPVSRSALAALQSGALNGDPVCAEWLDKHMISLGVYLAMELSREHQLDRAHVLACVDVQQLRELGFARSFSEWGDEQVHVDLVRRYVRQVIDRLYVITCDGVYVERQAYQRTAAVLCGQQDAHRNAPNAAALAPAASVTEDTARAVYRHEAWKHGQEAMQARDAQRLHRLKEIIRDSDMDVLRKLDFLETLVRMPRQRRAFFEALYGADDGIPKPVGEVAGLFSMTPEEAQSLLQTELNRHHVHYRSCVTQDSHYDLMEELKAFLLQNEENRRAYQAYRASLKARRRNRREYVD